MGLIILILICIGLVATLVLNRKGTVEERRAKDDKIVSLSNSLEQVTANLNDLRQVSLENETRVVKQAEALVAMTNTLKTVSSNLAKSEASLESTQKQLAERDAKITDLEAQNQALDQRATELTNLIVSLTTQIEGTQRKLTASEGDKAFLEKELQRLLAEKADLEKQFNDLSVLRAQVARLKEEMNIARRMEWSRRGLFASDEKKGAEQLMTKSPPREAAKQPTYDLNVEVGADGSIRVIPPLTNSAGTLSPAPK